MRRLLLVSLLAIVPASGCVTAYRADVQQGNVVTQEMVDKLKPGMTRAQVRFVLGTPLVTDPFHQDRWDYYYFFRQGRQPYPETRRLTLIFKDDKLVSAHGDIAAKASSSDGISVGVGANNLIDTTAPTNDTADGDGSSRQSQIL